MISEIKCYKVILIVIKYQQQEILFLNNSNTCKKKKQIKKLYLKLTQKFNSNKTQLETLLFSFLHKTVCFCNL